MEPITFRHGIIRSYMKGQVSCSNNLIDVVEPTSILWFIPTGHRTYQLPVSQVSSVVAVSGTKWFLLIISVLYLVSAAISSLGAIVNTGITGLLTAIIVIASGIWFVLMCLPTYLVIATTAGQEARIKFPFFDRDKASEAARQLNQVLSGRMDDTNVRIHTDRVVDAINNK